MYKNKNKKGNHMKEKITLLIALSFLVGLTVYKKSFDTDIELVKNIPVELKKDNQTENNMTDETVNNSNQDNYSSCDSDESKTDLLQFNEAFKYYRNCNQDTFMWNGLEYTTAIKTESNNETLNYKLDLVSL